MFPEEAWIDLHNPLYNVTCDSDGASCMAQDPQLVLTNIAGNVIDLTWWPDVKVDKASSDSQCIKYKDDGGGKMEDEECDKDKHAGCYIHCRKENIYLHEYTVWFLIV